MDLADIRREYLRGSLRRSDLAPHPVTQFEIWMAQAVEMGISDPTAMVLGTASREGHITQRIVLLKSVDEQGFVFFTNYESRKARDIAVNSRVSLHFPWYSIERQVMVSGVADKVSAGESRAYFHSRPRESQLAAWASPQSRVLQSRDSMLQQFDSISRKFDGQEIPLPEFWGGYRVRPCQVEFWQGGGSRLHDRFIYSLQQGGVDWEVERVAP